MDSRGAAGPEFGNGPEGWNEIQAVRNETQAGWNKNQIFRNAYRTPELIAGLRGVAQSLGRGRNFEAMKTLRGLFPLEDRELEPPEAAPSAA